MMRSRQWQVAVDELAFEDIAHGCARTVDPKALILISLNVNFTGFCQVVLATHDPGHLGFKQGNFVHLGFA